MLIFLFWISTLLFLLLVLLPPFFGVVLALRRSYDYFACYFNFLDKYLPCLCLPLVFGFRWSSSAYSSLMEVDLMSMQILVLLCILAVLLYICIVGR